MTTIKRTAGGLGYNLKKKHKKGTKFSQVKKDREDWYDAPMKGTDVTRKRKKYRKKPKTGAGMDFPTKRNKSGKGLKNIKSGGTVKKHDGGGMSHVGLYPAEEARAGVLPEKERRRFTKTGGSVKRKAGGTVKKQTGGLTQGYNARLDESLGARHRGTKGNLAARRHESEGMERALGHGPYSGARTMAKKGGSVSRKKGGTTSRKAGGKIMVGYKAGGRV